MDLNKFYQGSGKSAQLQHGLYGNPQRMDADRNETPQKLMKFQETPTSQQSESSEGKKILTFVGCVMMIYFCQIINGIVEQRIYKVPYQNLYTLKNEFYTDALTPMFFSSFFAAAIGYMRLDEQESSLDIPVRKLLKLAILEVFIHFGLMWALMSASYVLVVMANSCGLLSVILVGVYFSNRATERQYQPNDQIEQDNESSTNNGSTSSSVNRNSAQERSIGPEKIFICLIVCAGIFLFNYFTPQHTSTKDSTTQSASLITFFVLGFVILLQGVRPQLQTEIKQEYHPSPICFYFHYNKVQCLVVFVLSVITWQIPYTFTFILNHDQLFLHIVVLSLLNAFSAMFIYKVITMFRQHVYPLVSTVRKCITVGVSILYFGHHITFVQFLGILLVFAGVLLEVSLNYKLLQKWDINIPFAQEQSERYVKNKNFHNEENSPSKKKKYEMYKIIHRDTDIEGI